MLGFLIGLFVGSTVMLIVAACFSQERQIQAYFKGYFDGKREGGSNEADI